jgi:hypothetical protein
VIRKKSILFWDVMLCNPIKVELLQGSMPSHHEDCTLQLNFHIRFLGYVPMNQSDATLVFVCLGIMCEPN